MTRGIAKRAISKLAFFLCLVAFLVAATAAAQDFPSRPITIIVPFPAGGGVDSFTRGLTANSEEFLGVSVAVNNVTGGGGAQGAQAAATSAPDGYTLLANDTSLVTNLIFQDVPFDLDSFEVIGTVMRGPTWILSPANREWGTIENYIERAREIPGVLSIGVAGPAGSQFLMALAFESALDLQLNIIPYAGGGPLMTALLGGHVDAGIIHSPVGLDAVEAGELEILAGGGSMESVVYEGADQITTFEDLGIPLEFGVFRSIFAPAGLDPDVKQALVDGFEAMARSERFAQFGESWGMRPIWLGPEESEAMIRSDYETFRSILEEHVD